MSTSPPNPHLDERVFASCLERSLETLRRDVLVGVAAGLLLTPVLLAGEVRPAIVVVWAAVFLAVHLANRLSLERIARAPSPAAARARLLTLFALAGVTWAPAALLIDPTGGEQVYWFAAILFLAGNVAANVASGYGIPGPFEVFTIAPLAASVAGALRLGGPEGWILAIGAVLFCLSMWLTHRHVRAMLVEAVVLRFRNEDLLLEVRRANAALAHRARHDPLTGLANRGELDALLHDPDERSALLFIDLDGFKQINDTHGHAAGDTVLERIAARLRHTLRPEDTAVRMGGDEFVVVTDGLTARDAAELARRLTLHLGEPINFEGDVVSVSACIGVAIAAEHPGGDLLRLADRALYDAKQRGPGSVALAPASRLQRG